MKFISDRYGAAVRGQMEAHCIFGFEHRNKINDSETRDMSGGKHGPTRRTIELSRAPDTLISKHC